MYNSSWNEPQEYTYYYHQDGCYTDGNNCENSDDLVVNVSGLPTVDAQGDATLRSFMNWDALFVLEFITVDESIDDSDGDGDGDGSDNEIGWFSINIDDWGGNVDGLSKKSFDVSSK